MELQGRIAFAGVVDKGGLRLLFPLIEKVNVCRHFLLFQGGRILSLGRKTGVQLTVPGNERKLYQLPRK